ncbi:MAG TPA: LLM class flavin-dependent oxidoreductase [Bryobacteraceae bacterium]|nr:LLM class flavin-dependent oxidoreductase [Bryobacteraceae bacterium]
MFHLKTSWRTLCAHARIDRPSACIQQRVGNNSPVLYSVLDLAPVKKDGSIAEAFRNSVDLARHAERWGYTRFWLAEHHNAQGIASAATSVLIGHVAGSTSAIRVGSGGIMLPNHAPLIIAEQFGTLETLYPGRIDLGLGRAPGTDGSTARALGRDPRAADDFPKQVAELISYLEPPSPGQTIIAVPGAGTRVPVWLLGSSTFSAQLAAKLGLPFAFAAHFAPQEMMEAITLYRQHYQPSRFLRNPHVMIGIPMIAADTDAEARYLATTPALTFLQLIRGQPVWLAPPVESMDGRWSAQERFLVESRLAAAIVGGPQTLREKLRTFLAKTNADEIMINCAVFDHTRRLRSYQLASEAMQDINQSTIATAV